MAGPASLREGVGVKAPINREQVRGLAGDELQTVKQEVQRPWGRNYPTKESVWFEGGRGSSGCSGGGYSEAGRPREYTPRITQVRGWDLMEGSGGGFRSLPKL